jgi:hypothetical protein
MPTQKMGSKPIKPRIDLQVKTDLQAHRILLCVPDLVSQAKVILIRAVTEVGDPLKAAKLLNAEKVWAEISPEMAIILKQELSTVLAKKEATNNQLVEALEANPQGEARGKLIDLICERPAAARDALNILAKLESADSGEKQRLGQAALRVKSSWERARRSLDVLSGLRDCLPADLRKKIVSSLSKNGYREIESIMRNPQKYFPTDAPMTTEERSSLFGFFLSMDYSANLIVSKDWAKERVSFSDDELKQAITLMFEGKFAKEKWLAAPEIGDLLDDERLRSLLTPEQEALLREKRTAWDESCADYQERDRTKKLA